MDGARSNCQRRILAAATDDAWTLSRCSSLKDCSEVVCANPKQNEMERRTADKRFPFAKFVMGTPVNEETDQSLDNNLPMDEHHARKLPFDVNIIEETELDNNLQMNEHALEVPCNVIIQESEDHALDNNNNLQMDEHARDLPCDVIVDILLRLPDKPLAKLKLVSKPWYFMISNLCIPKISPPSPCAQVSGFIYSTHCLTRPVPFTVGFIVNPDSKDSNSDSHCSSYFSSLQDPEDFQDCCNGLLLLTRHRSAVPVQHLVYNPFTRESISLPTDPYPKHSDLCNAFLAFDPSYSLSFRVVYFSRSLYDATISNPPVVDIFCSETQTWSSHYIPVDPRVYGFRSVRRSIYLKGVLYRLSKAMFLISIDLRVLSSQGARLNLYASALELPDRDKDNEYGSIGTSGGCLYYSNRVELHMLFWVLDDGSKWVLKHSINMVGLLEHPLFVDLRRKSLRVTISELKTSVFHPHRSEVLLGTRRLLLRYHLETRSLELIYTTGTSEIIEGCDRRVFPYARCPIMINSVFQRQESTCE